MGMYTEIVLSTNIKDVPEVIAILKYLAFGGDRPEPLPEHPFFDTDRWAMLFQCSSHYFVPRSVAVIEKNEISKTWALIVRADLKNYDSEIKKFVDWINPYIDGLPGEMIGYSRYEESDDPIILRVKWDATPPPTGS